jgi:hypothetical protein
MPIRIGLKATYLAFAAVAEDCKIDLKKGASTDTASECALRCARGAFCCILPFNSCLLLLLPRAYD